MKTSQLVALWRERIPEYCEKLQANQVSFHPESFRSLAFVITERKIPTVVFDRVHFQDSERLTRIFHETSIEDGQVVTSDCPGLPRVCETSGLNPWVEMLRLFSQHDNPQHIAIQNCSLDEKTGRAFAAIIEESNSFKSIELNANYLGDSVPLIARFALNNGVQVLDLTDNHPIEKHIQQLIQPISGDSHG